LSNIKIPKDYNNPEKKISSLSDLWYGGEIDKIRKKHISNQSEEIEICKNCTTKDIFDWV